jgi:hypothetical protein
MSHITLYRTIKPGDDFALVIPIPSAIPAGSTLLFSIDGKPASLVIKVDAFAGWYRIEIEPYNGGFEIPAYSSALVSPPETRTIEGLAETFRLAAQEMKQNIDNFKATTERASAEITTILERHRSS